MLILGFTLFIVLTRFGWGKKLFAEKECEFSDELFGFESCECEDFEIMRYLIIDTYPKYYLKYTKEEQNLLLNLISHHPELIIDEGTP